MHYYTWVERMEAGLSWSRNFPDHRALHHRPPSQVSSSNHAETSPSDYSADAGSRIVEGSNSSAHGVREFHRDGSAEGLSEQWVARVLRVAGAEACMLAQQAQRLFATLPSCGWRYGGVLRSHAQVDGKAGEAQVRLVLFAPVVGAERLHGERGGREAVFGSVIERHAAECAAIKNPYWVLTFEAESQKWAVSGLLGGNLVGTYLKGPSERKAHHQKQPQEIKKPVVPAQASGGSRTLVTSLFDGRIRFHKFERLPWSAEVLWWIRVEHTYIHEQRPHKMEQLVDRSQYFPQRCIHPLRYLPYNSRSGERKMKKKVKFLTQYASKGSRAPVTHTRKDALQICEGTSVIHRGDTVLGIFVATQAISTTLFWGGDRRGLRGVIIAQRWANQIIERGESKGRKGWDYGDAKAGDLRSAVHVSERGRPT
ncbi:hypothetical protein DFH06DRAFT_1148860 [Mycena polygramma]|nr:hypothetical protein DFH06DRAFT_1148860 [Mycena polygramma]